MMDKTLNGSSDTLNDIDTTHDVLPLPDVEFVASPLLELSPRLLADNEDDIEVLASMTSIIQKRLLAEATRGPITAPIITAPDASNEKVTLADTESQVLSTEGETAAETESHVTTEVEASVEKVETEETDAVNAPREAEKARAMTPRTAERERLGYKLIYKRGTLLWKKGKMDKSQPVDVLLTESTLIGFKIKDKAKSKKNEEPKKAFELDFTLGYIEHEIRGGTRDHTFTVHGRDLKQQLFLKAESMDLATAWVAAIQARVETTYGPYCTQNKLQRPAPGFTGCVAKVGWLYVRSDKDADADFEPRWFVLNDRTLAYYASPPSKVESAEPLFEIPVIETTSKAVPDKELVERNKKFARSIWNQEAPFQIASDKIEQLESWMATIRLIVDHTFETIKQFSFLVTMEEEAMRLSIGLNMGVVLSYLNQKEGRASDLAVFPIAYFKWLKTMPTGLKLDFREHNPTNNKEAVVLHMEGAQVRAAAILQNLVAYREAALLKVHEAKVQRHKQSIIHPLQEAIQAA